MNDMTVLEVLKHKETLIAELRAAIMKFHASTGFAPIITSTDHGTNIGIDVAVHI